ncbi:RimJ/RimL family protein N-acetyltransferase [Sphingomonas leidyi]|uniref:RimJ/RimL family protein N-acetyltransferase n=1 Tax=Sphingomonas leidyi TaxID=68569 RepID=A0A7X5V3C6_9SPHN|nr:RimJ/RimL family protein N-acetyltransferase [Sphingomonas leidyi]
MTVQDARSSQAGSLHTARLTLRPARAEDLAALHAILSDPVATAYWSHPPHSGIGESEEWLAAMLAIQPGEGEDFIVEHEGAVIGKAGFYRFPEIGLILHPRSWGRGFAIEALGAVLAHGFEVHGLPAVTADVDPRNAACLRLLDRLGFRETGRRERSLLVGAEWCDSVDLLLERDAFFVVQRLA